MICDHLDRLAGGRLIPADGDARDAVLVQHALATGIMDASFASVMENRRPETSRSGFWLERWAVAIERAASAIRPEPCLERPRELGEIATAIALAHVDYRLPAIDWRAVNRPLADWFTRAEQWDAMLTTPLPPK